MDQCLSVLAKRKSNIHWNIFGRDALRSMHTVGVLEFIFLVLSVEVLKEVHWKRFSGTCTNSFLEKDCLSLWNFWISQLQENLVNKQLGKNDWNIRYEQVLQIGSLFNTSSIRTSTPLFNTSSIQIQWYKSIYLYSNLVY